MKVTIQRMQSSNKLIKLMYDPSKIVLVYELLIKVYTLKGWETVYHRYFAIGQFDDALETYYKEVETHFGSVARQFSMDIEDGYLITI